nr:RNA-directed DNA polymerase, eukaryota [Tanacetum cinerariifolium]
QVKDATNEFEVDGRIAWVEVEGVPYRLWTENTFARIADKWGKLLDVDDQDEACFHSKRLCVYMKSGNSIREDFKIIHRDTDKHSDGDRVPDSIFEDEELVKSYVDGKHSEKKMENSKDPFNLYSILNCQKQLDKKDIESDNSLNECCEVNNVKGSGNSSISSGHFKVYEIPRTGGSMVGLLEEVVKVRQVMGFKMEGCILNLEEIIGSQRVEEAIQETKMEKIDDFCVKQCWGNLVFDYVYSEAVGNSGGILYVWDTNSFCKCSVMVSDYFVINRGHWRLTGKNMMIIAVYAPQESKEKQSLWGFLHHEVGKWNEDVIIMGDFNEVRVKSDRFGSHFNPYGAQRFNSFISDSGLVEVNLGGCRFTWCYKSATKMSKLDIFLVSESVCNGSPNINAVTLESFLSGHRPILLKENRYDYGPTSFRFFHHWIEMDGFNVFVDNTWKNSPRVGPNALSSLMSKLKVLKKQIRLWNKSNMGFRKNEQISLKKKLEDIDSIIDSGLGNEVLINSRLDIIHQIQKLDSLDSKKRAQKAKIKWAIEGNENSGFFPCRFCKPEKSTASDFLDFPNQISSEQSVYLESEVTNADGFTFGFFGHFWHLVDMEVFEAVRPISLIGSIYKIIAKILTNRLVGVLGGIINEVQPAFIKDRQILDGPFILNEVMSWCKRKKKQTLLFKVDFEKAYDSVRWDFLDDVLSKFGFEEKWRKWIHCCLHSSKGSIIINGSPTDEFQFGKGLKQGDPLSPFLFLLVMETLHISFQRVVDAGMYQGIEVGSLVNLSHMFYADDAVFVGEWSKSNISSLFHVLDCFHKLSGLKINKNKSKIMGIKVEAGKVSRAAIKLGCLVLKSLFLYLGSYVLAPKVNGGLGISSLYALNRGLLFKWVWRFLAHESTLWSRVIKAIHGVDGNIDGIPIKGVNTCWTSITKEVKVLEEKGINLMSFMKKKLGNGLSTLFWEEGNPRGGLEDSQVEALASLVHPVVLNYSQDIWSWTLNISGEYTVASTRYLIDTRLLSKGELKTMWIRYVPIKVNTLAWKVMTNSLPIRFNILRCGIDIESLSCVNCDVGIETTNHLFFACDMAKKISQLITRWWDVPFMDVDSYGEWRSWIDNVKMPKKNKNMFEESWDEIITRRKEVPSKNVYSIDQEERIWHKIDVSVKIGQRVARESFAEGGWYGLDELPSGCGWVLLGRDLEEAGNRADVAVPLESIQVVSERSSYARALIEIRADVELKDIIVVAMPKLVMRGSTCVLFLLSISGNLPKSSNTSTTPIIEKTNEIERIIIDRKVTLVNDEVNPLETVDSSGDHDSEDEVKSIDNEMASFLASKKVGCGTNSLAEQWKETYENVDYDYDPYDDDIYEGQEIPDKIQSICDNLDIKVQGCKKK